MLSDDDVILGTAARFLLETGQEDAARVLLKCSLVMDDDEDGLAIVQRRAILTAPTTPFIILSDERQPITIAVKNALSRAIPRRRFNLPVSISIVVGFPERDAESQSALLQFAHGADAPEEIVDMAVSRGRAPQMLISPLSIFPVEQTVRDDQLCFVIMPFATAFDDVYHFGIKVAVESAGLKPLRGDDIQEVGHILEQIWRSLLRAKYVIADLSYTNGNVLYELGLAHALGHSAILLTQDINHVPFDLRPQRLIVYSPTGKGVEEMRPKLMAMLRTV